MPTTGLAPGGPASRITISTHGTTLRLDDPQGQTLVLSIAEATYALYHGGQPLPTTFCPQEVAQLVLHSATVLGTTRLRHYGELFYRTACALLRNQATGTDHAAWRRLWRYGTTRYDHATHLALTLAHHGKPDQT